MVVERRVAVASLKTGRSIAVTIWTNARSSVVVEMLEECVLSQVNAAAVDGLWNKVLRHQR